MSSVPAQEEYHFPESRLFGRIPNLGRKCPTCSDLQRIEPVSGGGFSERGGEKLNSYPMAKHGFQMWTKAKRAPKRIVDRTAPGGQGEPKDVQLGMWLVWQALRRSLVCRPICRSWARVYN